MIYTNSSAREYATLRNLFTTTVKGSNFITPQLIGYAPLKNGVIEITKGSNFLENEMWGVTVVRDGQKSEESKCCHSMREVNEYVESLAKV